MRYPPIFACLIVFAPLYAYAVPSVQNIIDHGAATDGKTLCTAAIQKAIDTCAKNGGGTVLFPKGTFLSGAIHLKNGVRLQFDEGSTLRGSRDRKDYYGTQFDKDGRAIKNSRKFYSLISGQDLQDIAITGSGTINGSGGAFRDKTKARPKNIYLESCRGVLVEGVRLRDSGSWMQHYRLCEDVTIRNVDIFNHITFNNDGLDIDSCRNVKISGCRIDSDDDAIVLKSLSRRPCENVTVNDCIISSHCNSIKCGTESGGGFVNIRVSNCKVFSPKKSKKIYGRQRGSAGIALEIVDGGRMENVRISDIDITGLSAAIFLRLGNRARPYVKGDEPAIGTMRDICISRIKARNIMPIGCAISGLPGHMIEDVQFEEIDLEFEGGGSKKLAGRTPGERPVSYPECTMFGDLPGYGFFCRHVRDIQFKNITLKVQHPDKRHAMVFDDAENVVIAGLQASAAADGCATIRLTQTRGAELSNITMSGPNVKLLALTGDKTSGIVLNKLEMKDPEKFVERGHEVSQKALRIFLKKE
ncbi:MAG: glycoside hydrolase family 28 protein [Pirellulales bacterium]|nr:glycoside hydrolase family 28 protein [Pirellulales bacterium]